MAALQTILYAIGTPLAIIGTVYILIVWIVRDPLGFFGGIWFPVLAIANLFMHLWDEFEKFAPGWYMLSIGAMMLFFASSIQTV